MRASDKAYRTLRDEIINWQLTPGTVLAEVEQATRLGVSRTPLREALSRLTADGLVASQTGRGLVVTDVSADSIRQLFELRRALEEQAVRLAAARRDRAIFDELAAEFDRASTLISRADDRHDYYDLVARLDTAIDDALNNEYLKSALENLRTHLVRVRRLAKDNTTRLLESAAEHLTITRAIADGDADLAAHATHLHLHRALQHALAAHDHPASHTTTSSLERTAS
ncbi:MAG TPA: GntR family transcriptional regulator [Terrimesophilobacter sp.]|nr:GntR family transcriptional regulator [Terrimesophilobacter sp.]HRQ00697.1 GntR family transcriptional regulator [Terrimesophilobacter sp.]